jgi:hypothetical protein
VVRARQLAFVAHLVRALHQNSKAPGSIPTRDYSCIFRSFPWLGVKIVYNLALEFSIYYIPSIKTLKLEVYFSHATEVKLYTRLYMLQESNLAIDTCTDHCHLYFQYCVMHRQS